MAETGNFYKFYSYEWKIENINILSSCLKSPPCSVGDKSEFFIRINITQKGTLEIEINVDSHGDRIKDNCFELSILDDCGNIVKLERGTMLEVQNCPIKEIEKSAFSRIETNLFKTEKEEETTMTETAVKIVTPDLSKYAHSTLNDPVFISQDLNLPDSESVTVVSDFSAENKNSIVSSPLETNTNETKNINEGTLVETTDKMTSDADVAFRSEFADRNLDSSILKEHSLTDYTFVFPSTNKLKEVLKVSQSETNMNSLDEKEDDAKTKTTVKEPFNFECWSNSTKRNPLEVIHKIPSEYGNNSLENNASSRRISISDITKGTNEKCEEFGLEGRFEDRKECPVFRFKEELKCSSDDISERKVHFYSSINEHDDRNSVDLKSAKTYSPPEQTSYTFSNESMDDLKDNVSEETKKNREQSRKSKFYNFTFTFQEKKYFSEKMAFENIDKFTSQNTLSLRCRLALEFTSKSIFSPYPFLEFGTKTLVSKNFQNLSKDLEASFLKNISFSDIISHASCKTFNVHKALLYCRCPSLLEKYQEQDQKLYHKKLLCDDSEKVTFCLEDAHLHPKNRTKKNLLNNYTAAKLGLRNFVAEDKIRKDYTSLTEEIQQSYSDFFKSSISVTEVESDRNFPDVKDNTLLESDLDTYDQKNFELEAESCNDVQLRNEEEGVVNHHEFCSSEEDLSDQDKDILVNAPDIINSFNQSFETEITSVKLEAKEFKYTQKAHQISADEVEDCLSNTDSKSLTSCIETICHSSDSEQFKSDISNNPQASEKNLILSEDSSLYAKNAKMNDLFINSDESNYFSVESFCNVDSESELTKTQSKEDALKEILNDTKKYSETSNRLTEINASSTNSIEDIDFAVDDNATGNSSADDQDSSNTAEENEQKISSEVSEKSVENNMSSEKKIDSCVSSVNYDDDLHNFETSHDAQSSLISNSPVDNPRSENFLVCDSVIGEGTVLNKSTKREKHEMQDEINEARTCTSVSTEEYMDFAVDDIEMGNSSADNEDSSSVVEENEHKSCHAHSEDYYYDEYDVGKTMPLDKWTRIDKRTRSSTSSVSYSNDLRSFDTSYDALHCDLNKEVCEWQDEIIKARICKFVSEGCDSTTEKASEKYVGNSQTSSNVCSSNTLSSKSISDPEMNNTKLSREYQTSENITKFTNDVLDNQTSKVELKFSHELLSSKQNSSSESESFSNHSTLSSTVSEDFSEDGNVCVSKTLKDHDSDCDDKNILPIEDVDPHVFFWILKYIYSGRLDLNNQFLFKFTCFRIYMFAIKYKLQELAMLLAPTTMRVQGRMKTEKISFFWKIENFTNSKIYYSPYFAGSNNVKWNFYLFYEEKYNKIIIMIMRNGLLKSNVQYNLTLLVSERKSLKTIKTNTRLFAPKDAVALPDVSFNLDELGIRFEDIETISIHCNVVLDLGYSTDNTEIIYPCSEQKPNLINLSKDLKFLFESKKFCDVCLRVRDFKYYVHRFILSARSPTFATKLKSTTTNVIDLDDIDGTTLESLLTFIYTGDVQDERKNVRLYESAISYYLPDLEELCRSYIIEHLYEVDVCKVLILAHKYQDEKLVSLAQDYVCKTASKTLLSPSGFDLLENHADIAEKVLYLLTVAYNTTSSKGFLSIKH